VLKDKERAATLFNYFQGSNSPTRKSHSILVHQINLILTHVRSKLVQGATGHFNETVQWAGRHSEPS
jgi:hypothetical protein